MQGTVVRHCGRILGTECVGGMPSSAPVRPSSRTGRHTCNPGAPAPFAITYPHTHTLSHTHGLLFQLPLVRAKLTLPAVPPWSPALGDTVGTSVKRTQCWFFKHECDVHILYLAFKFIESGLGLTCALLGLLGRPGMWRVLLKHLLHE